MSTVRAAIEAIATRVRILSLTECDFASCRIAVPPPLPRRYPPLPMVDRLQTELYGHAYCIPFGEEGWKAHSGEGGTDMRASLSAANASRTWIDRDWLVLEISPSGAATVAKRGAVRRIPIGEIVSPGAAHGAAMPPQGPAPPPSPFAAVPGAPAAAMPKPGQLVAITLPREHPEEGGFYFAFGEAPRSTLEGRPAVRFYWNVPADAAPDLVSALTRTFNARAVPFAFKCPLSSGAYGRVDSGTLYVARTAHDTAAPIVAHVHRAMAGRLRPEVPLFTKRLRPGLGFAEDPGASESFGLARCRLLAEALWTAFVRDASGSAAVLDAVETHFLANGIELERPHLNPFALDRYRHGDFA